MKEIEMLQLYMDELKEIPVCTDEELETLPALARGGDAAAKNRLAEGMLMGIARCALEFSGRGVSEMDLIQEGNIGLMMAIGEYQSGSFKELADRRVREMMAYAVSEAGEEKKVQDKLIASVQLLDETAVALAEELGREATLAELAERMKMPAEEVEDIMKLTIDALKN